MAASTQPNCCPTDTRWWLLYKMVSAAYANASSPSASLAPTVRDTRWWLLWKLNALLAP